MNDYEPSTIYESIILVVATVGLLLSYPLLRDEIQTRQRIRRSGRNGRLLNVASELIWLVSMAPATHLTLIIACAYRVFTPMHGHVIASTGRLTLTLYVIYVVQHVKQNRRRFPAAHMVAAAVAERVEQDLGDGVQGAITRMHTEDVVPNKEPP